jgi:hypothetical protein
MPKKPTVYKVDRDRGTLSFPWVVYTIKHGRRTVVARRRTRDEAYEWARMLVKMDADRTDGTYVRPDFSKST